MRVWFLKSVKILHPEIRATAGRCQVYWRVSGEPGRWKFQQSRVKGRGVHVVILWDIPEHIRVRSHRVGHMV